MSSAVLVSLQPLTSPSAQVASGNTSQEFGQSNTNGDVWNAQRHFLDCAEFTEAFAIAYDWMYDAWSTDQKQAIMWSIINLGLRFGNLVYTEPDTTASGYSWWTTADGNWNCVRCVRCRSRTGRS